MIRLLVSSAVRSPSINLIVIAIGVYLVADVIYAFYTSKGYAMAKDTFAKALARVEVQPGWPSDIVPYMQQQSEILLRENKIKAIPDWNKALRTDLLKKAMA